MEKETKMKIEKNFISGTGRRKTAVARVFMYEKKGEFMVNDQPIDEYFSGPVAQLEWLRPFHAIGVSHPDSQFSATIKVHGSGKSAQLGAVLHGISRALAKMDAEYATTLRQQGFLTRDSRMVERKKPFLRKARKRPQFSKR